MLETPPEHLLHSPGANLGLDKAIVARAIVLLTIYNKHLFFDHSQLVGIRK